MYGSQHEGHYWTFADKKEKGSFSGSVSLNEMFNLSLVFKVQIENKPKYIEHDKEVENDDKGIDQFMFISEAK